MKKLKNRFLSCLLSAAMIISMVPSTLASGIDAQPLAAGDSITIQEQSITTAATSVTVQTGYVFVKQKFRLGYTAHIPCCLS